MRVDLRYLGASGLRVVGASEAMAFAPNLARDKVFFDAEIGDAVRYREAMSALHDVVIGDLRFKKRDKTAYEAWKKQQQADQQKLRSALYDRALEKALQEITNQPIPAGLEGDFRTMHSLYWTERRRWAAELMRNDPDLFRSLVPCDPVVTVAPDVVFFECFSKDESAYGCLSIDRSAFRGEGAAGLGTTNVDYSLGLYDHFQSLRSYRTTRLLVDPSGFEVRTEGNPDVREQKIDLPPSWLRGFGQIQAALALPAREVELSVDVVYSILAYLKRHREKSGPRSIRFELAPGKRPKVVLEPWGVELESRGRPYAGAKPETIRVWGRRRLMSLARTLPLAQSFTVRLLGSGLPSVWCARLGDMQFVLALSGWTANDWTAGTSLEQHFGDVRADDAVTNALAVHLEKVHSATLRDLENAIQSPPAVLQASLVGLAKRGQLVYDFAHDLYRYRPILPVALTDALLGPEPEEVVEGRRLALGSVRIVRREAVGEATIFVADIVGTQCEAIIDRDGSIAKAKCACSHFFKNGLRKGPCRHLFALRSHALRENASAGSTPVSNPTPSASTHARKPLVIKWTNATRRAVSEEADRRGVTVSDIVEQAWKIGRAELAKTNALVAPAGEKLEEPLEVEPSLVDEMQREAARLDVSLGSVIELCFGLVKDTMRVTSSVLPRS